MGLNHHELLGMEMSSGSLADVRHEIIKYAKQKKCRIVVTPNVNMLVRVQDSKDEELRTVFRSADLKICDSRVLSIVGRLFFREPMIACPGADLVQSLLEDPDTEIGPIMVLGPSADEFAFLQRKFPDTGFSFVEAPSKLQINSAAWLRCLEESEKLDWDVGLICLSHPKQEKFAIALQKRGVATGVLMCVGASIDFLTKRQQRAPLALRKLGMEWLFRMLSNPRRLGPRYLSDAPRFIWLIVRHKFALH